MRRIRTIVVLLAGVGACLIVLRLADTPQWSRRKNGQARATRLIPYRFDEANSVVVERGGMRLDLQRTGTRWTLTQPVATGADTSQVMRFLDQLEEAPLWDRLPLHDLRRRQLTMADFGLAPPLARVVVRGPLYRIEVAFGMATPDGKGVYAALDSANNVVWVTDSQIYRALPSTTEQWRDRSLLQELTGKVVALELRRPGVPFIKVVQNSDGWQFVQPFVGRASGQAINAAVASLLSARIERFIFSGTADGTEKTVGDDMRTRLVFYGLDTESAVQAQLWDSGNPAGVRVRFGRDVEGNSGLVYALTPGDDSVVAVSNSVLQGLPLGVAAIRNRKLFDHTSAVLRRLNIQYADETVTLERRNGTWRMTAPVGSGVDEPLVKELVASLLTLQAEKLIDPDNPVAPVANDGGPLCRFEVVFADGVTQRVTVAQSAYTEGYYDLVANESPTVYVVASSNMPPQLTRKAGVLDLTDQTMLILPAQSIRRVTAKGLDRLETIERKGVAGDEQWVSAEGTADIEVLRAWAALFTNWRAERVVRLGASAQDLVKFGMGEPALEITIDVDSEAAVRQSVLVGRPTVNGGRYASVRGHDVIYEITAATVGLLERSLVTPVPMP